MDGAIAGLVLLAVLVIFAIIVVAKSVALIPQAEAAVIERLGRYSKTVSGQLTLLLPFVDRIRARVDLRERVVSFPPQPVITEDNLTVNIDTVVYFQVTNPQAAVYQISNYIVGVEQLTTTTLRNAPDEAQAAISARVLPRTRESAFLKLRSAARSSSSDERILAVAVRGPTARLSVSYAERAAPWSVSHRQDTRTLSEGLAKGAAASSAPVKSSARMATLLVNG